MRANNSNGQPNGLHDGEHEDGGSVDDDEMARRLVDV